MPTVEPIASTVGSLATPLQTGGLVPGGSRAQVFQEIYWVFLILGTLVGVVVIGYMLYNAYKYRERPDHEYEDADAPQLGELPTGGGKGRKLFLSFAISAVIVISLIVWTYGTLLYVEQGAAEEPPGEGDPVNVTVVGYQFNWTFVYPDIEGDSTVEVSGLEYENVTTTTGELIVPENRTVRLTVTARDVFHNFGIPSQRFKTDAIPGQTTDTWFIEDETGTYRAKCYELCGSGHSYMTATVNVTDQSTFEAWRNASEAGADS